MSAGDTRDTRYLQGQAYTELNTILAQIRRQRWQEPTEKQRTRILELQAELRELRRPTTIGPESTDNLD